MSELCERFCKALPDCVDALATINNANSTVSQTAKITRALDDWEASCPRPNLDTIGKVLMAFQQIAGNAATDGLLTPKQETIYRRHAVCAHVLIKSGAHIIPNVVPRSSDF